MVPVRVSPQACVSVHSLADVFPGYEQRYRDAQVWQSAHLAHM